MRFLKELSIATHYCNWGCCCILTDSATNFHNGNRATNQTGRSFHVRQYETFTDGSILEWGSFSCSVQLVVQQSKHSIYDFSCCLVPRPSPSRKQETNWVISGYAKILYWFATPFRPTLANIFGRPHANILLRRVFRSHDLLVPSKADSSLPFGLWFIIIETTTWSN
jgi:hypothetical protein